MNISLNGESIKLSRDKSYYVIDALYLNEIKLNFSVISDDDNIDDKTIKESIFPFTYYPFAVIRSEHTEFSCDMVKRNKDFNAKFPCASFDSDTGLIYFISKAIFIDFLKKADYDKLTSPDNRSSLINLEFWSKISEGYEYSDIGLLLAPNIESGYDFTGSGSYNIVT